MANVGLKSIKLKQIETVDFRKNERTCWLDFISKNKKFTLTSNEALLFISKSMNQLCFVYGVDNLTNADGTNGLEVIASLKFRISRGTWSPLRLGEYANQVGLELQGIKSFVEHYEEYLHNKRK